MGFQTVVCVPLPLHYHLLVRGLNSNPKYTNHNILKSNYPHIFGNTQHCLPYYVI
jgi:hypothetical protein